jgi:hypothetical protein
MVYKSGRVAKWARNGQPHLRLRKPGTARYFPPRDLRQRFPAGMLVGHLLAPMRVTLLVCDSVESRPVSNCNSDLRLLILK